MEAQKELISVIIPVYNTENYLQQCLESIIKQTYKNLEIIVVDDGSTDKSGVIADEFSLKDTRIKVIHKPNGGVSSARNTGINIANGKWIGFVDSDDTVEENYFETLINNALENNADISFGISNIIDGKNDPVKNNYTPTVKCFTSHEAIIHLLKADYFGCGINKIYRSNLSRGNLFPQNIRQNEDLLVNFFCFKNAGKIVYTDAKLYNYTHRIGSACRNGFNPSFLDTVKVTQKIMDCDTGNDSIRDIAEARWIGAVISVFRGAALANDRNTQKELKNIACKRAMAQKKHILKNKEISTSCKAQIGIICIFPAFYKCVFKILNRLKSSH